VTWRKYAEQQQRVQNQDAKQDALAAKQEARQNSADKSEEYRMQMYDVNSGRILRTNPKLNQQILQDTTILPADKTALIRWNETQYQAQLREDKQTADGLPSISNQKILSDMRDRVGSTTDPTTRQEVVDATSAGMLTSKDAHDMMWRVGQSDKAWQAVQRPFTDQFRDFKHTMLTSMTSTLKYLPPEAQMQKLNDIESDAQRLLRDAYQKRDTPLIRQMLDKNSPQWVLRTAAQSLSSSPSSSIQQQADEMRRQEKINQIPGAESQATSNPIKDALERAKQPYEPDKFEYQIINGQIMKRRIGAAGG
jgi:hypothetical protein